MDEPYRFQRGSVPLLVSFPHEGTELPAAIAARMTAAGRALADADWHVARLYEFVQALKASTLVARWSRYVIDLNRDPAGTALYPGADNTELCPTRSFASEPLYQPGQAPGPDEVAERHARYFSPYHARLSSELERIHAEHGVAVLLDAHTIRSIVPRFFEGVLPDLNLGSADGKSCDPELAECALAALERSGGYSVVRDGRFKGGYITRYFGQPNRGVHALQLELAQKNYMQEAPPFEFDEALADRLRPTLRGFVEALIAWAAERSRT